MSCYICGRPIEHMHLDFRDMKTAPCSTCEQVIQECVESFNAAEDGYTYLESSLDEFGEEIFKGLSSVSSDLQQDQYRSQVADQW